MKHCITWIAALLLVCAASAHEPETLTIVTYNIHHGRGMDDIVDLERIAAVIRDLGPHIVCLQEVDRDLPRTEHLDMPNIFAEKLGMRVVFEPNYQFAGGDYGNATLTSLPILAQRNVPLPNPINAEPRGCLIVTVAWQGMSVDVMNTHLGLNGQERLAQAEAIVHEFGKNPVILAGDMNENATAPGMQRLLHKLKDTIEQRTDDTRGTVPVDVPLRRIDYILVCDAFETIDAKIIHNDATRIASDHLPYKAVVQLRDKNNQ